MSEDSTGFLDFVAHNPPFDTLPSAALEEAAAYATAVRSPAGGVVYRHGDAVDGLHVVFSGQVELLSESGETLARLGPGECFGGRGLMRDGNAANTAIARTPVILYVLHRNIFRQLMAEHPHFARFFDRAPAQSALDASAAPDHLLSVRIGDLMTGEPVTISPEASVRDAARIIRTRDISCLPVCAGGQLVGILTTGDLADRVIAEGRDAETLVGDVMTASPMTVSTDGLGFDALVAMTERRISHLPVVDDGRLVGILTSTNLVKKQAVSAVYLVGDIAKRRTHAEFAEIVGRIPTLLAQMVGAGVGAYDVGRIVTSVADALTRRLIALAEEALGPAPVPYLWAACGSQGRREQTGVSDQDNCLILDDAYDSSEHGAYFEAFAKYVSDGLNAAGYVYCPGDMMATSPRWRQPAKAWRGYFRKWIAQPDEEAQMLASVMFDLRAIAGETSLFDGMQEETLAAARKNSIFRMHMVRNSLKHQPPLGLFRGMALIRSGEHKDTVDMKLSGVVPIVDLGRVYALMGGLTVVNTRERLEAAVEAKVLSGSGARDLLDAYDTIADLRLEHQARLIREGSRPDNFMPPAMLSELERNHLKDAFVVVKTMQSAAAQSHGMGG
ncbi:MAG: cyclic nucleotide-binding/CBS domain-containing protein [Rhodobacteraceae bacterium]|nr:MAG: cyclic nucleotide-binding/CBS domain-containing protein [Paracoccaceae bacterium]